MTTTRLIAGLLVVMATAVGLVRARGGPAVEPGVRTFEVTGVVTAPPADGRLMVAHDEIPGYMPAMTMPFAVGPRVPATLAAGDRVRFTLRVGSDSSVAEGFVVEGRDAAVAAALAAGGPKAEPRLKTGDVLPDFSLTTQAGRSFTAGDVRGRVTALTFIFTRCPVPDFCPLMVKRFQQVQAALDADPAMADVQLLSVTLDPAFDTPQVLDAYAKAMRADPTRWQFLTGAPAEIATLTTAFAIHVERQGVLIDHTLATAVIGADGRVAGIWRGSGWKAGEVLDVLRREASRRGTDGPAAARRH